MVSEPARSLLAAPAASRLSWLRNDIDAVTWWLLRAFALSIPFSIFVSQLLLVLTTAAAAIDWWTRGRPRVRTPLDLPIACFALASLLAAFLGLDPLHSLYGLRTYLQVVVIYLVYGYARDLDRSLSLARCLLIGTALTSAYRVLAAFSPIELPRLFLGQMTQSGQLLFAIGLALPLLIRRTFSAPPLRFALALYVLALVVNLKRGVWLGAVAAVVTVGLLASRRLVLVAGLVIALAVAAVPPVRSRVANSARDMFLPGNRYDIWVAAIDVVKRFPMGVGRKNGEILRDYPNIPQHHKHAHNNLLQITLENGYLGLGMFLWWMATFGVLAWRAYGRVPAGDKPLEALAIAVLASFVGFHVAGLVEYNFGDSEVLEMFFVMMGLGLVANEKTRRNG
jgi:O-antigen ligase